MKRHLDLQLNNHFKKYRQALVLLGARQVGKTTILTKIFPDAIYFSLDNESILSTLETYDINTYKQILGKNKVIILDELHLLSNPGRAAKIIYDQIPGVKLIITGSSSFHIKNKSGESMAGRKIDYNLYPLTFSELLVQTDVIESLDSKIFDNIINNSQSKQYPFNKNDILNNVLKYGLYPETIQLSQDKKYLYNLAETAIFHDIIELNLIDNKAKAKELLKLLAYQIGNLINYSEIASKLRIDQRTVKRYIEIFEQSYVLYRLYPYSTKKRSEIGKTPKIYFYDLGLRNALIDNFDDLNIRIDAGAMFENFIITEVLKYNQYFNKGFRLNYWRLTTGSEVDLVISNNQELYGCEIKLSKGKVSSAFVRRYKNAKIRLISGSSFY